MKFAIRPASRADLPAISALYAQHIGESIPGSFGDLQPVADWSFNDAFVAGIVDKPSGAFVAVAETDGVVVAMAIAYAQPMPTDMPCLRSKRTLYLESIQVDPPYRRMGLARMLLRALEKHGREHRFDEIELDVYVTNDPAARLYEASGFIPVKQKWRKVLSRRV